MRIERIWIWVSDDFGGGGVGGCNFWMDENGEWKFFWIDDLVGNWEERKMDVFWIIKFWKVS